MAPRVRVAQRGIFQGGGPVKIAVTVAEALGFGSHSPPCGYLDYTLPLWLRGKARFCAPLRYYAA